MKKRLIPTDCENRATINYSMLPHFKSANIFRFFCLSLFRDKHYNVRKTLDELKRITGDSLSNFNSQFKDFLRIKHYYLDNGFENKTKRCIYHIPPMELKCVTFSRKIIGIELESEYIGFFMQLVLLSRFADIELSKNNIIEKLKMDKKTYEKYIIELKLKDRKHSVNHVFLSPTSIINFTSKKPSYDDTRRSGRDNELLQRAQNDL